MSLLCSESDWLSLKRRWPHGADDTHDDDDAAGRWVKGDDADRA
jgi:hypothetical protein